MLKILLDIALESLTHGVLKMKTGPLAYAQIVFNQFLTAPGFPRAPGMHNGCCHNANRGCWDKLEPQAACRRRLPKVNRPAGVCLGHRTWASGAVELIGLNLGPRFNP